MHRDPGHVEVDGVRVADAFEEEAQVAAALDGDAALVRTCAEKPHELQVEQFDDLTIRQHGGSYTSRS